jgi:hypothetical protein
VCDRRIIKWHKADAKVIIEKIDLTEPKPVKLNSWTYFLGPSNSILDEGLAKILRDEIRDYPVDLEKLIEGRFELRRKCLEVAKEVKAATSKWMRIEGLSEDDIDIGFSSFMRGDSYVCGIDHLKHPFVIDFGNEFKFQIYGAPGTIVWCGHDPETDKYIEREMVRFNSLTNNRFLYKVNTSYVKFFQKVIAIRIFPKIIKFVAKKDFRVSSSCDLISIDKNGAQRFGFLGIKKFRCFAGTRNIEI